MEQKRVDEINHASAPVLVILPTYNEGANIKALIEEIFKVTDGYEVHVLVVDDNSPDGTGVIVDKMRESDERIRLLCRPGKMGLGTAYLAGFRHALLNDYAVALSMDADFSHSPSHLPAMIDGTAEAEIVIGSRYIEGGGVSDWPRYRKTLSAGANYLAHTILGVKARDCTSGYRAYRREILERIGLDHIRSDGYSFLIELVTLCERAGASILEVPIQFVDRRGGESKISKTEILKAFLTLWRMWVQGWRKDSSDADSLKS